MENKFIGYEITPEEKENIGWVANPQTKERKDLTDTPNESSYQDVHIKKNRENERAIHVIKEGLLLQKLESSSDINNVSKVVEDPQSQRFQENKLIKDKEGKLKWVTTLALERVEGKSLTKQENLSVEETIDIGIDIAKTLKKFRENGILHGDISPGNVMYNEQSKHTTIIDLEFAEKVDSTYEALLKGITLGFAPPEKIWEPKEKISSEIFSVAMTLVSCIANNPALKTLKSEEVRQIYQTGGIDLFLNMYTEKIREIQKYVNESTNLPEKLKMILITNIDPDPTRRFNRWEDLITALEMVKEDNVTDINLLEYMEKDAERREGEYAENADVTTDIKHPVERSHEQQREDAEKTINFDLKGSLEKTIDKDTELLVIGERHPNVNMEGKDKQNAQEIVQVLETLKELGIKPGFFGMELTTLYEEKLNEGGKIYLESNKPLIDYCEQNAIHIIPIAGDKDLEPGSQDFEDSIASKIQSELMFGAGPGIVLLGEMHSRKTETTGNIRILPATGVLIGKNYKTKVIVHRNINAGEPGAQQIETAKTIAIQNPQYINLYETADSLVSDIGQGKKEDCDLILLTPSKQYELVIN